MYAQRAAYSTWDPRKQSLQAQGEHPYQEIPYGDGPGPRGPIPDVPQHYAQVPPVPQRQGWCYFCSFSLVLDHRGRFDWFEVCHKFMLTNEP